MKWFKNVFILQLIKKCLIIGEDKLNSPDNSEFEYFEFDFNIMMDII